MTSKKDKLRSIDLFAGIGGIRLGFERAFGDEISTVFVSEWDEPAQRTYRANFNDKFDIEGDITKDETQAKYQRLTFALPVFLAKRSLWQVNVWAFRTITGECAAELSSLK